MPRKRPALKLQKAIICILANDPSQPHESNEAIEKAGEAVIDRIKKCFARANHASANETEMRAAFKMAERIIKQHGLENYRDMMAEDKTSRHKRGGLSKVNVWPTENADHALNQVWVSWLAAAIRKFFDCNVYSTEKKKDIEWTFYGIAEHTVSAAIAFEAVHNQIQEWAAQTRGVSTRNSYCLGIADGLVRLAEQAKKLTEEEARQYEARALAARITEEDIKQQAKLYRLHHPPAEPSPEVESDGDEMDTDESDHAGEAEGPAMSDNDCRILPDYSE